MAREFRFPSAFRHMLMRLGLGGDVRARRRSTRKDERPPHKKRGNKAALRAKRRAEIKLQAIAREQLQAEVAARKAEHEASRAELIAAVGAERAARKAEYENLRTDVAATLGRIDTAIARTNDRVDAVGNQHRERITTLESLLSETRPRQASDHPPANPQSPLVSVILPTRDRAHVVCEAMASVQAQCFADWELIVVDDGSQDDTAGKIAPHLADVRIRYFRQPAGGASAARNAGLAHARGSLIAYLDSDNLWYPDFLATAVEAFLADPTINLAYGVLVSDVHEVGGTKLLWKPFDREGLLSQNFIDMNVVVHRKSLVDRYGGFDEKIGRQSDWDLVLRYTEHAPARALPVLAARYRIRDDIRISDVLPFGPDLLAIQRKWYPASARSQNIRVLYVVWHYPQLSESYIETEIRCMLRWGVHVDLWCEAEAAAPYPSSVAIHRGSLAEAVELARPNIIHVHWLSYAIAHEGVLASLGLPVTIRLHGFEVTTEGIHALLDQPWVRAVYAFPHHLRSLNRVDSRLRAIPAAFDSTLFRPHAPKDRRLVVRTSAALPSKDLPFFLYLATRLPEHRFVLIAAACTNVEHYVDELCKIHREMNSPAELMFNVQRQDLATLMAEAAIYVHTARPPGTEHATPIGMPVSIAEAMATGAHVLVRDVPEFADYVGEAGTTYRDADEAAAIIRHITALPEPMWRRNWMTSVDRAFGLQADELALRPILEDWCSAVGSVPTTFRTAT